MARADDTTRRDDGNGTQADEQPQNTGLASSGKASMTGRIVSASVGSVLTALVVTPLDVVKVRTQAATATPYMMTMMNSAGSSSSNNIVIPCPRGCGTFVLNNGHMTCVLPRSAVPYFTSQTTKLLPQRAPKQIGTLPMVRQILMEEGFAGIYAGLSPTLAMALPATVLYYGVYEELAWQMRQRLVSSESSSAWAYWIPPLAGGSARFLASSMVAPFEFLRTRQASAQGYNRPTSNMWKEFRTIVRDEGGVLTLYRGLGPTLWRDVPFSAIYWLCLDQLSRAWQWARIQSNLPATPEQASEVAAQGFVNGALAGMVSALCTTPFDVVKTRMQAVQEADKAAHEYCTHDGAVPYHKEHSARSSSSSSQRAPPVPRSSGTFGYMRHIAETEGVAGLWRGNHARMIKVAPACAIMIASFEYGKRIIG